MCYTVSGKVTGIFPDILNEIAKLEGWKIDYIKVKFAEGLEMIKKGRLDVLVDVAETPDRASWAVFNEETVFYNWGDVFVPSRSSIKSLEDLDGKKIAVIAKDVYSRAFENIAKFFDLNIRFLEIAGDYPDALEMVLENRVDGCVVSRIFGETIGDEYELRPLGLMLSPVKLKYMFRKDLNRSVISKIDEYLSKWKLEKSSIYQRSITRHFESISSLRDRTRKFLKIFLYVSLFSGATALVMFILVLVLRKTVSRRTEELERGRRRLLALNEELSGANRELESVRMDLEIAVRKLNGLIELIARLGEKDIKEEEFLRELLYFALENVPEADYGSVWIVEKGKWKLIAAVGHDESILKELDIDSRYLYPAKDVEIVDLIEYDMKNMPEDIMKKFRDATKPISKSMVAPLMVGEEYLGNFSLDIAEWKDVEFGELSINFVRSLSLLASALLANKRIAKMQGEFFKNMLTSLVRLVELRDVYTKGHSERVAELASLLAEWLNLGREFIRKVYWAGLVHDVGKVLIEDTILKKPGRFTPEEKKKMEMHPVYGAEILEQVKGMEEIAKMVRHHHERWDGKGYPDGLEGEEIPLGARIIAVVDAFDAMMSDRPYRESLGIERTLEEIKKNLGKQFDPKIGEVFLKMIVESDALFRLYKVKFKAS